MQDSRQFAIKELMDKLFQEYNGFNDEMEYEPKKKMKKMEEMAREPDELEEMLSMMDNKPEPKEKPGFSLSIVELGKNSMNKANKGKSKRKGRNRRK